MKDIDKVAVELNAKYGDIVEVFIGGERMIMITGAEYMKSVLNSSNYYVRWTREEGLKEVGMYKTGIAFNHVIPHWKSQRNFFKNSLGGKFIHSVVPTAAKNTMKLVQVLKSKVNEPINISNYFNRLQLDNIGELAFAQSFNTVENGSTEIADNIVEFLKAWVYFVTTPPFVYKHMFPFQTEKYRKTVKRVTVHVNDIIQSKRNQIIAEVSIKK